MSTHARVEIPAPRDDRPLYPAFEILEKSIAFPIEAAAAMRAKRCADILLALIVLPFLLLIALPVWLLVLLEGGSPLYRHLRLGRYGRVFHCYKFRTMTLDADTRLRTLLDSNHLAREEWSEQFKLKNDPRVTRLGHFLRKSSLDELPQIWNVLKGEMSFIGPRPIIPDELEKYGAFAPAYLACRPGVSGLWQISGRNDTTYEARIAFDAQYAQNWSLALDAKILWRTIPAILKARGSY